MKRVIFIVSAIVLSLTFATTGAWAKGPEESLASKVAALEATVAALQEQLAGYQALFNYVRVDENEINGLAGPHVIFEGANVHIRSGAGATNDNPLAEEGVTLSGLGNLIVGYNEDDPYFTFTRTGSHNLVVGPYHSYESHGGFVTGFFNTVTGENASVSGGTYNQASGYYSSVSGGAKNIASGNNSSVSGGFDNEASGGASSISGGSANKAMGVSSSAGGGYFNKAQGRHSSVSGGSFNEASGDYSSVSGGYSNKASGYWSSVSGGAGNEASGNASSVSGGKTRNAPNETDWAAGSLFEDF